MAEQALAFNFFYLIKYTEWSIWYKWFLPAV